MKYAADFRRIARDALRKKWGMAVVVGLVAALLGGTGSGGLKVELHSEDFGVSATLEFAGQTLFSTAEDLMPGAGALFAGAALYITLLALAMAVLYFVLSSVVAVGYARSNLELVDGGEASFEALFGYFSHWKNTAWTKLRKSLFILGWSILLLVPGILAAYSYAMTDFLLAEDPELSAEEAMSRSRELMLGNRWRLFCLQISFIGWSILSAMTLGIGDLWLTPYRQAATAAFYRELTGGYVTFEPTL